MIYMMYMIYMIYIYDIYKYILYDIYMIYMIYLKYMIYIYILKIKKCMVWYTSFKPGTLLALMPKEPIDCFAKVLPCSAASAAVFSESVLAGASSAGEGWRKKVLLDCWMSFMTHKPGNTISNHFDCMGKQGTSFRWTWQRFTSEGIPQKYRSCGFEKAVCKSCKASFPFGLPLASAVNMMLWTKHQESAAERQICCCS